MTSTQLKTPVHSHPLSAEEISTSSSRGRRHRASQSIGSDAKPKADYFALKAQLEQDSSNLTTRPSNWDGSVRGYSKLDSRRRYLGSPNSRGTDGGSLLDTGASPKAPNLSFATGSPDDTLFGATTPAYAMPPQLLFTDENDVDFTPQASVLSTRWHGLTDDGVHSAILGLDKSDSSNSDIQKYQAALRSLSFAYHSICRAQLELEEKRRILAEREAARKSRGAELLKELQPSERDIAKRVLQSLFTDDDEIGHKVVRKQSSLVRHLHYSQ